MVVDNYAKKLSKYGEVVVIAPSFGNKKNNQIKLPYQIIRVNSLKFPCFGYSLALPFFDLGIKQRLIAENFDIIHIHSPFTLGRLGIEVAHECKIPVIATIHSQFKKDFLRYVKVDKIATKITKKLVKTFNRCNECWTVNKKMIELFQEYGCNNRMSVINNATDFTLIEDRLKTNEIVNKKYNLEPDETVLLFVGRIVILKNILFIIDALNHLKHKKYKFKMLFVGNGIDLKLLETKIKEHNLEGNVILCGEIKDRELLKAIYRRSKLFIFPSLYDTNSLVQIEAASQKIPTLFLEGAITASTVKDNINGFFAPSSAKKFADKIIKILANKKLYDRVSERAYKDVYKDYDKVCKKIYNRYLYLIKNNPNK